ncbi:hypothetical protein SCLCIDRAFT_131068 [Scleroderma citrinum Foug A]|uniref:Uncharacterized protein n=1 Tax=Scleroderma citrinum Foug A TaxID=1036808 RepID=A0A0C3DMH3_9AGAM|nr:hypothetical protein SCLCIDRAFT_131068 [Scleroderma citrinum Foug A]
MDPSISCCCGRMFSTSAALKNHFRGCNRNKKRLSSALTKAQESYAIKRRHLSPHPGSTRQPIGVSSNQVPDSPMFDGDGSQIRSTSVPENSLSEVGLHSEITPLAQRPRPIYQTQSNSFGLFRHYDKESIPTHDPEDIPDDIARPSATRAMGHLRAGNPFHPYPNEVSFHLGDWYWNQGASKSKHDFKQLLGIIGSPTFRPDDIRNTKWASIDHTLGALATDDDPECSSEWLDSDGGWKRATVTISVPIPRRSTVPGPLYYRVSDFYYCPLVSIICERVLEPNHHHLFHYEPYELLW